MHPRFALFSLSFLIFSIFTLYSYTVAKEFWQQVDFDTTVKIQDRIPRTHDQLFSYFSFLGSAEITVGITIILATLSLIRRKIWAVLGWSMIIPATIVEVFGKLFLLHPGPPVLLHRTLIDTPLPSFYIHTNFSYPSGHMTRTAFLVTVFILLVLYSSRNLLNKLVLVIFLLSIGFFMALTRVYLGEHWLSDVIGGGLLGLSSGFLAGALIISKKAVKIT